LGGGSGPANQQGLDGIEVSPLDGEVKGRFSAEWVGIVNVDAPGEESHQLLDIALRCSVSQPPVASFYAPKQPAEHPDPLAHSRPHQGDQPKSLAATTSRIQVCFLSGVFLLILGAVLCRAGSPGEP
jgi:hypothetical protein